MRLIVDVDGTLTYDNADLDYRDRMPRTDVIERVNLLHQRGVSVVIYSARNMRTHEGNLGRINKYTLPKLIDWLDRHKVQYDEIYMGKPWCGHDGFYVEPRSMRPDRFVTLPIADLELLLGITSAGSVETDSCD